MAKSTPEQRAKRAAYMREWRLRPENHERVKAQQREKHARNRDADNAKTKAQYWANRDASLAVSKKWRQDNRERHTALNQAWAAANREKVNAASRRWRERNRITKATRLAAYASARRARQAAAGVFSITDKDLRRIMAAGCVYCGAEATEMDHLIPVVRGGRHSIGNLVGSCRPCNRSKNHRLVMEWRVGKRVARGTVA